MHGYALELAIDLVMAADVRMCTHSTHLAVKEVDIGMPFDMATLSRLSKVVNHAGWVKEIAMKGRTFSAEKAFGVDVVECWLDRLQTVFRLRNIWMMVKRPLGKSSTP
jgi:delta(3,5)-delta(2,4)-dienoyl-CoA isomerase